METKLENLSPEVANATWLTKDDKIKIDQVIKARKEGKRTHGDYFLRALCYSNGLSMEEVEKADLSKIKYSKEAPVLSDIYFPINEVSKNARKEQKGRSFTHIRVFYPYPSRKPLGYSRAIIYSAIVPAAEFGTPEFWKQVDNCVYLSHPLSIFDKEFMSKIRKEIKAYCQDRRLPAVVDPYSGGGSFPIAAVQLGLSADWYDINPLATAFMDFFFSESSRLSIEKIEETEKAVFDIAMGLRKTFSWMYPSAKVFSLSPETKKALKKVKSLRDRLDKQVSEYSKELKERLTEFLKDPLAADWVPKYYYTARNCRCLLHRDKTFPAIADLNLDKKRKIGIEFVVDRQNHDYKIKIARDVQDPKELETRIKINKKEFRCPVCGAITRAEKVKSYQKEKPQDRIVYAAQFVPKVLMDYAEDSAVRDAFVGVKEYLAPDEFEVVDDYVIEKWIEKECPEEKKKFEGSRRSTFGAVDSRLKDFPDLLYSWNDLFSSRHKAILCWMQKEFKKKELDSSQKLLGGFFLGKMFFFYSGFAMTYTKNGGVVNDFLTRRPAWYFNPGEHTFFPTPFLANFQGPSGLEKQAKFVKYLVSTTDPEAYGAPSHNSRVAIITDPPYGQTVSYPTVTEFPYLLFKFALPEDTEILYASFPSVFSDKDLSLQKEDEDLFKDIQKLFERYGASSITLVFAKSNAALLIKLLSELTKRTTLKSVFPVQTENPLRGNSAPKSKRIQTSLLINLKNGKEKKYLDLSTILNETKARVTQMYKSFKEAGIRGIDLLLALSYSVMAPVSKAEEIETFEGDPVSFEEAQRQCEEKSFVALIKEIEKESRKTEEDQAKFSTDLLDDIKSNQVYFLSREFFGSAAVPADAVDRILLGLRVDPKAFRNGSFIEFKGNYGRILTSGERDARKLENAAKRGDISAIDFLHLAMIYKSGGYRKTMYELLDEYPQYSMNPSFWAFVENLARLEENIPSNNTGEAESGQRVVLKEHDKLYRFYSDPGKEYLEKISRAEVE